MSTTVIQNLKLLNSAPETITNTMDNYSFEDLAIMAKQGAIYHLIDYLPSVEHRINFSRDIKEEPNSVDFGETILTPEVTYKTTDESMAVEALRQLSGFNDDDLDIVQIDLSALHCEFCNETFRTTADLNTHKMTCEKANLKRVKRCPLCLLVFENNLGYYEHNCSSSNHWPCKFCGELYMTNLELVTHIKATHDNDDRPYKCTQCSHSFVRLSSLTNHIKIHSYQPGRSLFINCSIDENKPVENYNLNEDPLSSNWNSNVNYKTSAEVMIESPDAADLITSTNNKNHRNTITETPNLDPIQLNTFPDVTSVNSVKDNNSDKKDAPSAKYKPHVCSICQKTFSREKALANHEKLHTLNLKPSKYACEYCDKYFSTELNRIQHMMICPRGSTETIESVTKIPRILSDMSHSRKLKTKGKVPCLLCDSRFPTNQKMKRHMWVHRKKPFNCELCARTFERQIDLDKHRGKDHPGGPNLCKDCGRSFTSRQGLWEHSRSHVGDTSSCFTCEECNKTYSSRQGYLIHQRTHTGERPYGCRFCYKAFKDGGTLRKHERIHTGERPHVCPLCSLSFTQKVVLREHVRWMHTENKEENACGLYTCPICAISIPDKEELCFHIIKHSDHLVALMKKTANDLDDNNLNRPMDGIPISTSDLLNINMNIEEVEPEDIETLFASNENACDLCGVKFDSQKELLEHVRIHI